MMTKGLRYIQIRKNAVRANMQNSFIHVEHIAGKRNVSDLLFTKEDKESAHFMAIRGTLQATPPTTKIINIDKTLNEPGHSLLVTPSSTTTLREGGC